MATWRDGVRGALKRARAAEIGYVWRMRAFMLEVPESLLAERRRSGADLWDEVWDGVLHLAPPPSRWHQRFGSKLFVRLEPIAEKLGFEASYETSIYRPNVGDRDYRTPDIVVYAPSHGSQRGVEGIAELAVEILSPGDETYEKLPFYVEVGVREILVVNPDTRAVELFVPERGNPKKLRSAALGVNLTPIPGPKLRVVWPGGTVDI